jgi:hypothetical protein
MKEIGKGNAFGAVDFGAVIHAAEFGPTFFGHGDGAVSEFEDEDGVVVTFGFGLVDVSAHLGVDGFDGRATEYPPEEFNGVAAHVHGDAAAGAIDVPEMRSVRAVVFFRLFKQDGSAKRAAIEELFEADVFRRETQLLGVHQFDLGFAAGGEHLVGFGEVEAHRFFQDDMFAGASGVNGDLAMKIIGHAENHHVDLIHLKQLAVIFEMVGDVMFFGKVAGVVF